MSAFRLQNLNFMVNKTLLKLILPALMTLNVFIAKAREVIVSGQHYELSERRGVRSLTKGNLNEEFAGTAVFCGTDNTNEEVVVPSTVVWNDNTYMVNGMRLSSGPTSLIVEDSPYPFSYNVPSTVTNLYIGRPVEDEYYTYFEDLQLSMVGFGRFIDVIDDRYNFNARRLGSVYINESDKPLLITKSMIQHFANAKNWCLLRELNPYDGIAPNYLDRFDYLEIGGGFRCDLNSIVSILGAKELMISDIAEYCRNIEIAPGKSNWYPQGNIYLTERRPYRNWKPEYNSEYKVPITELHFGFDYPSVPDYAFFNAKDLKNVTFSSQYTGTRIGKQAFFYCDSITSLFIPASVQEIGDKAFYEVPNLKSIEFEAGLGELTIGVSNFLDGNPTLDSITVGRSIVIDPKSLESILAPGPSPFYMKKVKKIVLKEGIETIPDYLFKSAYVPGSMFPITIPESVTSIGEEAFRTTMLNEITIGSNVDTIGSLAFGDLNVETFSKIVCKAATPPHMPKDCFLTPGLTIDKNQQLQIYDQVPLHVPIGTTEAYSADVAWGQFKTIIDDQIISPKFYFLEKEKNVKVFEGTFTLDLINNSTATPVFSSSNPEVATIDSSTGLITVKTTGITVIEAYVAADGAFNAAMTRCVLYVQPKIEVTDIVITPSEVTYSLGDMVRLDCSVYPSDSDVRTVVWSVSDPNQARILEAADAYCLVECLDRGNFTITAECDGVKQTVPFCAIVDIEITSSPESMTLYIGETGRIIAQISTSDGSTPELTWTSQDPVIASVDIYGTVTALSKGKTVICATSGSAVARCSVDVIDPADIYSISFPYQHITVNKSSSVQLQVNMLGHDYLDYPVKWVSDNNDVATVDERGVVTGISEGCTKIHAVAGDKEASLMLFVVEETASISWVVEVEGARYTIDPINEVAKLTGYTDEIDKVVVPAEVVRAGISYPVIAIASRGLYGSKIRSLTIPAFIRSIGNEAIAYCKDIEELIIEDCETPIEGEVYLINNSTIEFLYLGRQLGANNKDWFFRTDIKELMVGGDVMELPTFYGCNMLERVEIHAPVNNLGRRLFYDCPALKELILPAELKSLEDQVFYGCPSIRNVIVKAVTPPVFYNDLKGFDDDVFKEGILYVPAESEELYRNASVWKNFSRIEAIGDSGIEGLNADDGTVTVFDLLGHPVLVHAPADMLNTLQSGFYIVNNHKMFIGIK